MGFNPEHRPADDGRKGSKGGDRGNQHTVAKPQNEAKAPTGKIANQVAAETGTSTATVERSAAYLAARLKKAGRDDLLEQIGPGKRAVVALNTNSTETPFRVIESHPSRLNPEMYATGTRCQRC